MTAAGFLTALLLSSPAYAETFQFVVPPGQERLLGAMVGVGDVAFPGPCRLVTATTVKSVVRLAYTCGAGAAPAELQLVLHPPDYSGPALGKTDKFVLARVARPPPDAAALPDGFVDALLARVRSAEARWHWMKVRGDHQAAQAHLLPTPPPADVPAGQALDPRHVELFERGAALLTRAVAAATKMLLGGAASEAEL